MEKVIMPKRLTAENGAKKLLLGEFAIMTRVICDACNGEGYEVFGWGLCRKCEGAGEIMTRVDVPWTVIKDIYSKAVEHLSQPVNTADAQCQHPVDHIVGESPNYFCGICGAPVPR